MAAMGKWLLFAGLGLALFGALLWVGGRWLPWLGKLPGDIRVEGEKGGFYFPIVTCLILSLVISLVLSLMRRFFG